MFSHGLTVVTIFPDLLLCFINQFPFCLVAFFKIFHPHFTWSSLSPQLNIMGNFAANEGLSIFVIVSYAFRFGFLNWINFLILFKSLFSLGFKVLNCFQLLFVCVWHIIFYLLNILTNRDTFDALYFI